MRITLRLIFSLVIVVTLVVSLSAYFQARQEQVRLSEELERRAGILAESLQETVEPLLEKGPSKNLQRIVEKFGNRERLSGVAVKDFFECKHRGKVVMEDKKKSDMYFAKGILPNLVDDLAQIPPPAFLRRYRGYFQKDPPAFPASLQEPVSAHS